MLKTKQTKKLLKCSYCGVDIYPEHDIYNHSAKLREIEAGTRQVFCSKGHGTAWRHANLSPTAKKEYHDKIAATRKSRTPEQKAESGAKLSATFKSFSPEKKQRIRQSTEETIAANGGYEPIVEKRHNTLEENLGPEWGKVRHETYRQNMLEKTGFPNSWCEGTESREKGKQTNLELYGSIHPTQNEEIKNRAVGSYVRNNGGMGNASPTAKAAFDETMLREYGTTNCMLVPEIAKKAGENYKKSGKFKAAETKAKNGTTPKDVAWKGHETKKRNGSYTTNKQEQYILFKLKSLYGQQVEHLYRHHPDYPWEADFYDPVTGTIFEFQGYFTHGKEPFNAANPDHQEQLQGFQDAVSDDSWAPALTIKIWTQLDPEKRATAKAKKIPFVEWFNLDQFDLWFDKQLAKKLGSSKFKDGCFKIDEAYLVSYDSPYLAKLENKLHKVYYPWDDLQKVANQFKTKDAIAARKTDVVEITVEQAAAFCKDHHLQGSCRGVQLAVGLVDKLTKNLVAVMTFGKPRYNKNYDYELLRLCFSQNITGGAQKMWKYAKEQLSGSVISYCDLAKFSGAIYSALGFESNRKVRPSIHWYNQVTGQHVSDNLLRQRGFDQVVGARIGVTYGKGTSNENLMKEHGFVAIQDCGQAVFTLEN